MLGKITRIEDLRTVWPHEEHDFSAWLAKDENLTLLGDTLGITLSLTERESAVGNFSVDLVAYEEGTDRRVVIENQLTDTDHDHLGKIITYAAGKNAEIVVWIVKRAREEHQAAIEWLNRLMPDISFFLIEMQLWRIDESRPAPKFAIIEQPNNWAKTMVQDTELSDTKEVQLEFWNAFSSYADKNERFKKEFRTRKARPQHWYNLSTGTSKYYIDLTVNTQKNVIGAGIYIRKDKELFEYLSSHADLFEEEIQNDVEWIDASVASRILVTSEGDILNKQSQWNSYFDWLIDTAVILKTTTANILDNNQL